jgi:hypothetical protein
LIRIAGTTERFAIKRDHFALGLFDDGIDPLAETGFEPPVTAVVSGLMREMTRRNVSSQRRDRR